MFLISGNITINNQELETRDGFGIWNFDELNIKANEDSELLLMEVPMDY
ncbi:MAG: hypothetical protein H7174_04615 [Flavobacterium sp.]|nr:hypothetical protein [Flavobacterium sp.]